RRDAALAASEEAVKLHRALVGKHRDAVLPNLASALSNVSGDPPTLARRDGALAASEEAVKLRRELVGKHRHAFLPDLARALGRQGQVLLAADRPNDAVHAFHEGALLLKPLAASQ